ncbi:hypothetical protein LTR53_005320 [Teratosphaeriaceae sp. CCFEE 6253]|nr:hypothetical protein LTR53_005320 [Teratosphaeriaceae sp. CCFEE 6253]
MADPEPQPTPSPTEPATDSPPSSDGAGFAELKPEKRSDFVYAAWDKFLFSEPKRAKTASHLAAQIEARKQTTSETPGDGLRRPENAAKQYDEAVVECKAKVAAIVAESVRLNRKYVDFQFDLEANDYCLRNLNGDYPGAVASTEPPPSSKRVEDIFDNPRFSIDGAAATDIHQGSSGNCWFLAALMALSARKELVTALCPSRDEKVGVYGFVFYRDGEWVHEVIDDKLFLKVGDHDDLAIVQDWDRDRKTGRSLDYDEEKLKAVLQRGGESLYFSHTNSDGTWLPLVEKAYAKAHGDYTAVEGGDVSESIEDLTGGVGVVINSHGIMDKDRFWHKQLSQVNVKYLFGGGTKQSAPKGLVGGHAYAVLRTWECNVRNLKLVKLRNPWGKTEWEGDWSDGSKLWTAKMMTTLGHTFGDDGVFWMSYVDFLKHVPHINRVRLFDRTWKVSQDWTTVRVPWTVDYLDTKWEIEVTKRGPVVIVLSQPDDRYFRGLQGRYVFTLRSQVY